MLIAAAAVVSAVIFAAGCISSDEDDDAGLIGTWYHGDDSFEAVFTLAEDNTGLYCLIKDDAGKTGVSGPFPHLNLVVWDVDGDKLSLVCDDGRTITGTVNEKDGFIMTDRLGIGYKPVDLAAGDTGVDSVWYYEGDTVSDVTINMAEGSGVEYRLEAVLDKNGNPTGEVTESVNQYTWEADNEDNAVVTYSDGTVEHLICGEDGTLTSDLEDDALYLEMPGRLDAFMSMLAWAADKLA